MDARRKVVNKYEQEMSDYNQKLADNNQECEFNIAMLQSRLATLKSALDQRTLEYENQLLVLSSVGLVRVEMLPEKSSPAEATTASPEATTTTSEATNSIPLATTGLSGTTTILPRATTTSEAKNSIPLATTGLSGTTTILPRATTTSEATNSIPLATTGLSGITTRLSGTTTILPRATTILPRATTSLPTATPSSRVIQSESATADVFPTSNNKLHRIPTYAQAASRIVVELEGKLLSDGKVFDTRTLTFPLGEGGEVNIPDGLERALEKFLKGEKSRVTLKPKYAFKSEGNAALGVPSNSSVEYTVKLTNFERAKESWAMDGPEKLEQAKIYKEKGTNYFKQSKYLLAIKMYKKVVTLVDDIPADTSETEENKKLADEYLLSSHLNLSLVYLKVTPPHYFEARDHATKALDIDENNVKGLFRRGQALLGMGETEQAMKDFQQVLSAEPQNKAASNQLIICRSTIQKQKQKEKQLYANMFDKFAKHDVQAEKERAKAEVDVIGDAVGEWGAGEGEWTDQQRAREPTEFEKENPNILLLDKEGQFKNM
ncbi:unnamed protein product [Plutella xylostella]|uniref:peptidylprolyl isomerase n=1 Tax=Plutella xylostella TaxID=51655 RepID=A0A8S4F1W3_PLUXY|nr:unnamed protein product [Plutella xylostella]